VYSEIVVFDRNLVTGLTQLHIERSIRKLGISGPIKYAGNAKTLLAYQHQAYLLKKEGLVQRPTAMPPADTYQLGRYTIMLVGLPAAGKTLLRNIFSQLDGFSVHKWGKFVKQEVETHYGVMDWETIQRFTNEVEAKNKVAVAQRFVASIAGDNSPYIVVDGIKSREQIIYASYALQRPAIVISVVRDEDERRREAGKRGDFDDSVDTERLNLLHKIGAVDVMDFADFTVNTTGCSVEYGQNSCRVVFPEQFIAGMHEILSWIFVSKSYEETKELVISAAVQVAKQRGFAATIEVV
jgi:dephospho-CoA kinase